MRLVMRLTTVQVVRLRVTFKKSKARPSVLGVAVKGLTCTRANVARSAEVLAAIA